MSAVDWVTFNTLVFDEEERDRCVGDGFCGEAEVVLKLNLQSPGAERRNRVREGDNAQVRKGIPPRRPFGQWPRWSKPGGIRGYHRRPNALVVGKVGSREGPPHGYHDRALNPPDALERGSQQHVGIVQAIVGRPAESTSETRTAGVDVPVSRQFRRQYRERD